ncbi:sulfur carrier protein ThiS [Actinoplanes sp. NPDC051411]|uniref:sulfur carrier protein ThiS n=1 Tax=Actinoplanes sp. NPDC051411 TaxID=3155522 RepID=UPI0034166C63
MRVTVNGQERSVFVNLSVDDLVTSLAAARRGVAVAVNGTVVPRSSWAEVTLADGDTVEVLTAAQGG